MKNLFFFLVLFLTTALAYCQEDGLVVNKGNSINSNIKPSIKLYKMYSINSDTTYVDTTLSIQKKYKYNPDIIFNVHEYVGSRMAI